MGRDLAAMAYIEQQILGQAAREGTLQGHARRIEEQYGLENGFLGSGLIWQTRVLSLLYTLVLFPKEYWRMDKNDPIYKEIDQRWWSTGRVDVITQDRQYENTAYGFIHRLRNALAHARVSFRGDDIEFSDSTFRGEEVYRARISRDEASRFLETVGSIMANRRNKSSAPHS